MTTQTPPAEESAPPALFDHCRRTYQAMLREAQTVIQPSSDEPDELDESEAGSIVVYEGFLTHLVTRQLNYSVPYYTSIRNNLIRMGCIRQLKRGGGSSPSQWELIYEPSESAFLSAQPPKRPKQTKQDALAEQVRNLSARVSELEGWQKQVNTSLVENFGVEDAS